MTVRRRLQTHSNALLANMSTKSVLDILHPRFTKCSLTDIREPEINTLGYWGGFLLNRVPCAYTGGLHTMTENTSPDQPSVDGGAMASALAALSAIESVLGTDDGPQEKSEFTFDLPLADALRLVPEQYVKSFDADEAKRDVVTVTVENLFNQLDALKFLAYIGQNGFPRIIPVIQCQASDSRRLVFSSLAFHDELQTIATNTTVGIFGLNLKMQSVFVRGVFRGFSRYRGITLGVLDIDWVYNSMPPKQGQIYPEIALEPVVEF